MRMNFHNDDECYLLFGKELNKIIAMLQMLADRNPNVDELGDFIDKMKSMRSYDEMLDSMIMETRVKDISEKQKGNDGLSLNEILKDLDIRKWKDSDRKD
jgi:hypothetical protein|tara:strand:+ start:207 stop:506 length:300 start_codon:yes stop_codon:yes gene_type:complete